MALRPNLKFITAWRCVWNNGRGSTGRAQRTGVYLKQGRSPVEVRARDDCDEWRRDCILWFNCAVQVSINQRHHHPRAANLNFNRIRLHLIIGKSIRTEGETKLTHTIYECVYIACADKILRPIGRDAKCRFPCSIKYKFNTRGHAIIFNQIYILGTAA